MNASPKLQKAGRAFLLRLVYENGPDEAANILRDLACELEALVEEEGDRLPRPFHTDA
jgi:hypothetical protein